MTTTRTRRPRRPAVTAQPGVKQNLADAKQTLASTTRTTVIPTPTKRHRTRIVPRRVGSNQVVSYRGRRRVTEHADPATVRFAIFLLTVLFSGLGAAMALSGVTTDQTFQLENLRFQSKQLDNQIESLTRDVQAAHSAADITRRAADMGLVVPDVPGVINIDDKGIFTTVREPETTKTLPIMDVNGARVRPVHPSSDPKETAALMDNLHSIPAANAPQPGALPAVAPYSPTVRKTQAGGSAQ